jgi:hypothetical protein
MTDRVKLLEAVAEAARAWLNVVSRLPYQDQRELDAMSVCENALNAVYSIDAIPAEPVGETVEVRGCAGVSESGEVYGYCSTRENDDELRWQVESCDFQPTAMFTIRVPKSMPLLPTVTARVET